MQDDAKQDNTREDKARQGKTKPDNGMQDDVGKVIYGTERQDKPRQNRQDKIR
jgi:hypothetical protein